MKSELRQAGKRSLLGRTIVARGFLEFSMSAGVNCGRSIVSVSERPSARKNALIDTGVRHPEKKLVSGKAKSHAIE